MSKPVSSSKLARRSFLRGAGVALSLPWLEAMVPTTALAFSTVPKNPVRMGFLYMPNGVNTEYWYPKEAGRDFALTPTLAPLRDVKDKLVVMTNLWNQNSKGGDGHYVKESAILTCQTIKKTPGADIRNGTSVDQLAAQKVAHETPLPSIELGVTPVAIGVDAVVGYTRIYGSHIAWSNPTTPLAREINPASVYERMYRAASGTGADSAKMDTLLLDRVLGDARQLRTELGSADKQRLDEYLTTMRSLEQRIERASGAQKSAWKPRVKMDPKGGPAEKPQDHAEHVRLMMDMIATAFQTDTTRVCTFMFGNAVSEVSFRFVPGVDSGHHETSHHGKNPDKLRQYQLISQWHVAQYAYLLNKLASMNEGDSTVLDNSMVMFASALSDGDKHDPHNLPLVVGGGGGGRVDTGQHLVFSPDSPLANLYVSMLDAFGAPVERFADSTGPLQGFLKG